MANSLSNKSYEFLKLGAKKTIFWGLSFKALNFAALKGKGDFYPKSRFGTNFFSFAGRVIKFVLEVLYSKYGYSEGGRGRLTAFCGRRAPKMICTH